jgi:hypothetical protein
MKKGKSRSRHARTDILRYDAAKARRKARRRAWTKGYQKSNYDGTSVEES